MNANLRQLEAFLLVYRLGNLTRAAREMHVTQSAISLLIRQLEDAWQTRLFDRTTRLLNPTQAAHDAHPAVERILGEVSGLANHMRGLAGTRIGRVSFAVTAGVASALMPQILSDFRRDYAGIDVIMHDVAADQLVAKLLSGEAEFSIGTVDDDNPELSLETLIRDQLSAIGMRDGSFETRSQMSWDDLAGFATISIRRGGSIRSLIDDALGSQGRLFTPTYEVSLLTTALSMTAHGLGLSILPSYLVPLLQFPGLTAIPLVDPIVTRHLSLIQRSGRSLSPACQAFILVVRQAMNRFTPTATA